jgi:hypothetical protein
MLVCSGAGHAVTGALQGRRLQLSLFQVGLGKQESISLHAAGALVLHRYRRGVALGSSRLARSAGNWAFGL